MAKAANEKDFQTVANEYGQRVVASMRDDLEALKHAQECKDTTECTRGKETKPFKGSDGKVHNQLVHNNPDAWHDEEAARRIIAESPLSIEVRSDWHAIDETGEDREYNILLGTGGPAARIIGELEAGSPSAARFEYQDWFKPWTEANLSSEDQETLLEFAQQFYFSC